MRHQLCSALLLSTLAIGCAADVGPSDPAPKSAGIDRLSSRPAPGWQPLLFPGRSPEAPGGDATVRLDAREVERGILLRGWLTTRAVTLTERVGPGGERAVRALRVGCKRTHPPGRLFRDYVAYDLELSRDSPTTVAVVGEETERRRIRRLSAIRLRWTNFRRGMSVNLRWSDGTATSWEAATTSESGYPLDERVRYFLDRIPLCGE